MSLDELQHGVDLESLDETRGIGRRTFLMGALATGAAASAPFNYAAAARKRRIPLAKDGSFPLGVASGFPRPKGITLWTQLDGVKGNRRLRLLVAEDRKFNKVVEERTVTVRKDRGHTARTFVKGLKPDEQYFYRFVTEDSKSPLGRFKTAPPLNSNKPIRIAFYSCQNWEAGFYNAQRAIANEPDLDLVICLGDYIYEYSAMNAAKPRQDRSGRNKDGDVQFIDEYRQKYHLYKSDPDLKAMHAAHPFIAVWDDHEVENNHADGKPTSAQPDPSKTDRNYPRRVTFEERRANGYRAFFNYTPRMRFKGDRNRIYEDYRLGKTVDLMLTDERQYRDQQPCNDAIIVPCPDSTAPGRTLLGAKQKQWLLESLEASPATWKVWGTQLMLMGLRTGAVPEATAQVDAWDGYAAERREILDRLIDRNVSNIVAITGDIHTFFAGTATTTGDKTAGNRDAFPEFVGGAATSDGLPEQTDIPAATLELLAPFNGHLDFYEFTKKGYGVVEANSSGLTCELKAVDHHTRGNAATTTLVKYRVAPGARVPERIA
jgi:alkaline phosphatase D